MSGQVRVVTCNALKTLNAAQVKVLLDQVLPVADVVLWQELRPVHRHAILQSAGWASYFPGDGPWGVGISWRTAKFVVHRSGRAHRVVPGIKHVDPARGFLDIVLRDRRSATLWAVLSAHMTHQAFTKHPERRPRWRLQAVRLRLRSRRLARKFDRMIGGGDMNRHHWHPGGTYGSWAGHGTYGKAMYDTLWRRGRVGLTVRATRIRTPSDHDALHAVFSAG